MNTNNCLSCKHYLKCKDPHKSIAFICNRFEMTKDSQVGALMRLMELQKDGVDESIVKHALQSVNERLLLPSDLDSDQRRSNFKIATTIKEAVANAKSTMVSPDVRLPEGDFKQAPNFVDWCLGKEFLASSNQPYIWQLLAGIQLLIEFCPRCSDVSYFDSWDKRDKISKLRKKIALLEHGVCPHCSATKAEMINSGELKIKQESAIVAGQRVGKSAWVAFVCSYLTHWQLKLQRPNEVYGVMPSNVMHGTFVALTYYQAKQTLFDPFFGEVMESPWFKEYHEMLKHYGHRYGEELFNVKDTFLHYKHRRLFIYPAAPDIRVLRGRCLTGSTMVNSNHGFMHLRELIDHDGQVPIRGLTIDSHEGNAEVSHTYKDRSKTIRVKTRNGFQVEGTPEHPMLVLREDLSHEWVRLDEIQEGDYIVSMTKNNRAMFGDTHIDKDLATIAGYMVANGYRSDNHDVTSRLCKCYNPVMDNYDTIVKDFLEPIGYKDQSIPLGIRTAPKAILHEFLEAYFECDSEISVNTSGADSEIEIRPANLQLAEELHVILFHAYSILGRMEEKVHDVPHSGSIAYTIRINGYDAVEFLHTFKRAKVQKYADHFSNTDAKSLKLDTHYEQVVSVQEMAREVAVYDVTVPEHHAFTANCLASHNTRVFGSLDELGWFPNDISSLKNVKMNAAGVHDAIQRSLRTVRSAARQLYKRGFSNVPTGIFANVSSPSSVRDKIMMLYRQSQVDPSILGIQGSTWDLNPNIEREDLATEFLNDPSGSMRDYGAQPPLSANPFISVDEHITNCYGKKHNPLSIEYKFKTYKDGSVTTYGSLAGLTKTTRASLLTLDCGLSNNSFAFTVMSLYKGYPRIDVMGEVIPSRGAKINYTKMQELLEEIITLRNVKMVAADRWNSLKILHDIRDEYDIPVLVYSLKYADMRMIKDYMESKQLMIPAPKWDIKKIKEYDHEQYPDCFKNHPVEHFVLQALTVQDTGTDIIKGDNLTDDIFRAAMLGLKIITDDRYAENFPQGGDEVASGAPMPLSQMMYMKGASVGGGGSSSNGVATPHISASGGKAVGMARKYK